MKTTKILMGMSAALFAASAAGEWVPIQLDKFQHGQIIGDAKAGNISFDSVNFHHADSRLVAFDTRLRGSRDPELEGPNAFDGVWAIGNVADDKMLGTVLILQQIDDRFAGYADEREQMVAEPDHEERAVGGTQPGAGQITLRLDESVYAFRFTIIDVERNKAFETREASYAVFAHGDEEVTIAFAELIDPDSAFYDPGIRFGDGSANHFPVVTAGMLGLPGIDRVAINLGGSGAIGALSYIEEQPDEIGLTEEQFDFGAFGSLPFDLIAGAGDPGVFGTPGGLGGSPSPPTPPGPRDPEQPLDPPTAIPSPGAGLAGALLMSLLMSKRPRRKTKAV